jgi:uncharacterized protein (DUF1778 family)
MADGTQISAEVSPATKALLDEFAESTGIKKGRIVEDALAHHLEALRILPADIIIPARLTVTARSGARLVEYLSSPPGPTQALRDLMAADGD